MTLPDSILNFFISSANAADAQTGAAAPQGGGGFSLMLMLVVFVLFMYFSVWRPQSKRAKEHRNLLNALTAGDEVVTTGGMLGRVNKVTESYVVLSIAEGMNITLQKAAIAAALPKGTIKSI